MTNVISLVTHHVNNNTSHRSFVKFREIPRKC